MSTLTPTIEVSVPDFIEVKRRKGPKSKNMRILEAGRGCATGSSFQALDVPGFLRKRKSLKSMKNASIWEVDFSAFGQIHDMWASVFKDVVNLTNLAKFNKFSKCLQKNRPNN